MIITTIFETWKDTFWNHREPFLERTFQLDVPNNHNSHDLMYMKEFQKSSLGVFKTHYHAFKPSLDEIKNSKIENLQSVEDLRQFLIKDCSTLFQVPFEPESRVAFYREIERAYPNLPNFPEFNDIVRTLRISKDSSIHASSYFRDEVVLLKQTFYESRV